MRFALGSIYFPNTFPKQLWKVLDRSKMNLYSDCLKNLNNFGNFLFRFENSEIVIVHSVCFFFFFSFICAWKIEGASIIFKVQNFFLRKADNSFNYAFIIGYKIWNNQFSKIFLYRSYGSIYLRIFLLFSW